MQTPELADERVATPVADGQNALTVSPDGPTGGVSALVYCVWTSSGSNCMTMDGDCYGVLGLDPGRPYPSGSGGHICIDP